MFSSNTIVEIKNMEFLKNVFPLKVESVVDQPSLDFANEKSWNDLRRSKRQTKETSFWNDFWTYLIENDLQNFCEVIFSFYAILGF